jgi:hypothetical protein
MRDLWPVYGHRFDDLNDQLPFGIALESDSVQPIRLTFSLLQDEW